MTNLLPVSQAARELLPVNPKAEYEAFCVWSRSWFPDSGPPAATSTLFDAWMASARNTRSGEREPAPSTQGWDHRYRRLDEGEIIRADDEVQNDDGSWRKGCLAAGQRAPDPNYTSHRVYRRLREPAPSSARELLPCPFCANAGDIESQPSYDQAANTYERHRGWCNHCGFGLDWHRHEGDAITAWNTRSGEREPATSSERELLREAQYHLDEGLTAALPSDEQGWMVRERFAKAKAAIDRALASTTQEPALDLHTLEEAAKVVDESAQMFRRLEQDARAHDLEFEAARIRALKGGEQ